MTDAILLERERGLLILRLNRSRPMAILKSTPC
jgi:hypothetical protein